MPYPRPKPPAGGIKSNYPGFIPPALATSITKLPSGERWLHEVIRANSKQIIAEWENFARTLVPAAEGMSPLSLRNHIHYILAFIADDINPAQDEAEQIKKSRGEKRIDKGSFSRLRGWEISNLFRLRAGRGKSHYVALPFVVTDDGIAPLNLR